MNSRQQPLCNKELRLSLATSWVLLSLICAGCTAKQEARSELSVPSRMVHISAGTYSLGAGKLYPEELPIRNVSIQSFAIDMTEVTNADFKTFVNATGYVTFAERQGKSPNDPPPGSACCRAAQSLDNITDRWTYIEGANWKHPHGKNSSIEGKPTDPVVHVTFEDAMAYSKWAEKDLPTQDEWEVAARGGLVNKTYEWGDNLVEKDQWRANVYQGEFPKSDSGKDGYKGISPVKSFSPNGYGLYDMTGNVWELTKDDAPTDGPSGQPCHWAKGGSFLCAPNYCARYRPTARIPLTIDTSAEHVGFRCVKHFK